MDAAARRLKKQWLTDERERARAALPAPVQDLTHVLAEVEEALQLYPCDHTMRLTLASLSALGLPLDTVTAWLHERGGFCDCEVVANVGDHLEQLYPHP